MFPRASRDQRHKYEKYLAPGEELEYVAKIGDRYYWSMVLTGLLLFSMMAAMLPLAFNLELIPKWIAVPIFFLSPLGMWPFLKVARLRHSLRYLFTTRRVIIKKGILSLNVTTAPYDKLTHIQVEQDMSQRFFYSAGTIILHTAGPTPVEMKLIHIEQPFAVKNMLEDLIHQERQSLSKPAAQPWPNTVTNEVVTLE